MDYKPHITIALYLNLGKLFYAIALSDKKIQREEVDTLKKEISVFNTKANLSILNPEIDIAHHIITTFDMLYLETADAQTCFDDFVAFKRSNEVLFTASLKKEILEVSSKIATSFSNVNKAELMMLAKLSIEFKK